MRNSTTSRIADVHGTILTTQTKRIVESQLSLSLWHTTNLTHESYGKSSFCISLHAQGATATYRTTR